MHPSFDGETWSRAKALRQQSCEKYVQILALIASNNMEERRCSNQANVLSYIMRAFNRKAVLKVKTIRVKEASTKK